MITLDTLHHMRAVVAATQLDRMTMALYYTESSAAVCGYKACIMGEIALSMHSNLKANYLAVKAANIHTDFIDTAYKELGPFAVNLELLTADGTSFVETDGTEYVLPQMLTHPHVTSATPRPVDTLDCIDMLIAYIENRGNTLINADYTELETKVAAWENSNDNT